MPIAAGKTPIVGGVVRRPTLKFEVDQWNWESATSETIDITDYVIGCSWQRTIKNPNGNFSISLFPQKRSTHLMDILQLMDAVRIYEFGRLKFLGYITRVATSGEISPSGEPSRAMTISGPAFGALLAESMMIYDIALFPESTAAADAAKTFAEKLTSAEEDGITYTEMVTLLLEAYLDMLESVAPISARRQYLTKYLDLVTAVSTQATNQYPREVTLFHGGGQVSLWSFIQKITEAPFNEFFFDVGPRKVWVEGTTVELPADKEYLIGRRTPFDGTIVSGATFDWFTSMPSKQIELNYLVRFDLNRSTDEVVSFFSVAPVAPNMSENARKALGEYELDDALFNKYLYKPLTKELYYVRKFDLRDTKEDANTNLVEQTVSDMRVTLRNWYVNNEKFTSGALTVMVPEDWEDDVRIGEKVNIEGIDGYLYCEGVSHSWKYQGALTSNLSVTRGLSNFGMIKLKDKIFKTAIAGGSGGGAK